MTWRDSYPHKWDKFTLETRYAKGTVGRGGYHGTGTKIHIVRQEIITAIDEEYTGTWKVGKVFSAASRCNSNGQHIARPMSDQDKYAVTCEKCLR